LRIGNIGNLQSIGDPEQFNHSFAVETRASRYNPFRVGN